MNQEVNAAMIATMIKFQEEYNATMIKLTADLSKEKEEEALTKQEDVHNAAMKSKKEAHSIVVQGIVADLQRSADEERDRKAQTAQNVKTKLEELLCVRDGYN